MGREGRRRKEEEEEEGGEAGGVTRGGGVGWEVEYVIQMATVYHRTNALPWTRLHGGGPALAAWRAVKAGKRLTLRRFLGQREPPAARVRANMSVQGLAAGRSVAWSLSGAWRLRENEGRDGGRGSERGEREAEGGFA